MAYVAGDDAKAEAVRAHPRALRTHRAHRGGPRRADPRIDYARSTTSPEPTCWPRTIPPSPSGWASTGWRRTSGRRRRATCSQTARRPRAGRRRHRTTREIGDLLVADIGTLYAAVHAEDFIATNEVSIATVSNGASGLLEEIAVGKVTGEENWWSHYDLYDFQANLEGARIAFDLVAPIAERKGEEGVALVAEINEQFDALQAELHTYGNLDEGFVLYDTVTSDQQADLTARIDALREPLSKLTSSVLGIA
ncbi:MAG: EfeM/EfeO family lipoprotein [Tessaracoccus sp.]